MLRILAAVVMALVSAVALPAFAADPTPTPVPDLLYEQDRLTVHVEAMPLADLLSRLAAASGATIRGDVPDRTVTVTLDAVPLAEGLDKILGAHSFALKYGSGGTLRAIELLGVGTAPAPTVAAVAPAKSAATPAPLEAEEAQAAVLQRTVAVPPGLANAVGSEEPSIGRILHAATRERNPEVRAEAREALLAAFAADPEAEAAYLSTLTPVEDDTLASILRTSSGDDGAEAWLAALTTRARSEELRQKAAAVLVELRKLPPRPR